MTVKMSVRGEEKMIRRLTDISRIVQESTEKEMREIAEEIVEGSEKRAPFKSGDLEDSHNLEVDAGLRGVKEYKITVGPVYGDDGVDYSLRMHEGIDGERYNLGPGSKAKNKGPEHRGEGVGWKFLQRSFDKVYRTAMERIKAKARAGMKSGVKVG